MNTTKNIAKNAKRAERLAALIIMAIMISAVAPLVFGIVFQIDWLYFVSAAVFGGVFVIGTFVQISEDKKAIAANEAAMARTA